MMNFRILHFTVLVISLMIFTSCLEKDNTELIEQHKRLAGELRDSKLYEGAIEEYQKILKFNSIDVRTRANINYLIGKIYFENLKSMNRQHRIISGRGLLIRRVLSIMKLQRIW